MLQKMKDNCRELCWELYVLKLWLWLPTLHLNDGGGSEKEVAAIASNGFTS
ncbi:hypothetical protein L195_g044604 [Trifolium pratense]|uniref:Uncharacterized protein n=1 Tax=Trifolium pratense TaxID=57577 RepID=A0A2K3MCJ6_TRIPR|nr:hypothetical protein L195_g044604 [Trifolium pratense]